MPAVDPEAPTSAPGVNQPPNGLVASSNSIAVGGTAGPIAGSTVDVVVDGTTTSFAVDATTGAWGGTLSLPPGDYDLTFAQTVGGSHTGPASAAVNVKVPLPGLTLTSPAADADIEVAPPGEPSVTLIGQADPQMGDVIVAEGDGRFLVERARLAVTAGQFNATLSLDYGKHQMKIFQRRNGLDGPPALRTLTVLPPPIAPGITAPRADDRVQSLFAVEGSFGLQSSPLPGRVNIYAQRPLEPAVKIADGPLRSDGTFAVAVTLTGAGERFLSASQVASSLSGGGTAEGRRTADVRVIVIPGAPTITQPATGYKKPWTGDPVEDLRVDVAGSAEPGTKVILSVDGVLQPPPGLDVGSNRAFATSLQLSPGTHRLTAFAEVLGTRSDESRPAVLVTVGDVKAPIVRPPNPAIVCDGAQPECLGIPDATGAPIAFASRVTVTEDDGSTRPLCAPGQVGCVPPCGAGVTASCFTCSPASGSRFPLGATEVTCTVIDDATPGNHGSTTFLVSVRSTEGPIVSGHGLSVEAEGPAGAVVSYQVSANGFITDCAPPGSGEVQACSTWKPANAGLGFSPVAVTVDASTGWVYAAISETLRGQRNANRLFRSQDHGLAWDEIPSPGVDFGGDGMKHLAVRNGVIYLPSLRGGIRISPDQGTTWSSALGAKIIHGLVVDPVDPLHQVAWDRVDMQPPAESVYETRDGWATYDLIGNGLPSANILAAGIDHFTGRVYVSIKDSEAADQTFIYRRVGGAFRLAEVPQFAGHVAESIGVAPAREQCATGQAACEECNPGVPTPKCQTFATVVAGTAVSRDGGESWQHPGRISAGIITSMVNSIEAITFDTNFATNKRIYAASLGRLIRTDGARSPVDDTLLWTSLLSSNLSIGTLSLAQDATQPSTLYSASTFNGFFKSTNGGTAWSPVAALELSLAGARIKEITVDPVNPQVAFLVAQNAGMFRTTNGGKTWELASAGMDSLAFQFSTKIAIDRFDRHSVYAGGQGWLWKTPNALDPSPDLDAAAPLRRLRARSAGRRHDGDRYRGSSGPPVHRRVREHRVQRRGHDHCAGVRVVVGRGTRVLPGRGHAVRRADRARHRAHRHGVVRERTSVRVGRRAVLADRGAAAVGPRGRTTERCRRRPRQRRARQLGRHRPAVRRRRPHRSHGGRAPSGIAGGGARPGSCRDLDAAGQRGRVGLQPLAHRSVHRRTGDVHARRGPRSLPEPGRWAELASRHVLSGPDLPHQRLAVAVRRLPVCDRDTSSHLR